ncbi:MAG TPA: HEAT repeat domain-containing protein [Phycisphaerae bacterium]|nr:HEAT repeat domain-containing protein [Phycisphaerae bacterium]
MNRTVMQFRRCYILLAALSATTGLGQQTQPAVTPEQSAELERARTIITDSNASAEVRRIGAGDLLRLRYPAAAELATEILIDDRDPLPRLAICEAIGTLAAREPELLDHCLVEPLLDLMVSPDANLRAKAAVALSRFRDGDVAARLGRLAAEGQAPMTQRLAAVDALAPNVAQREVIEQLIRLLETDSEELRRRVIAALRPASREDCGTDVARWRAWWDSKRNLDETGWLLDRVELLSQKSRELQTAMTESRAQQAGRIGLLSRRLAEELEVRYRLTPQPQKDELLIGWLADPLVDYRRSALSLIRANISDNNPPSAPVRESMRRLFADETVELRLAVFDVIAALTDPADADPARARLGQESDPSVREAILRTLGRLQNPVAIEDLTAELANPDSPRACAVAAATSLGLLATLGTADRAAIAPAIDPLKRHFAATPPEELSQRAALLQAMADIGSTDFAEEFVANLDAGEPDLLLPALAGVRSIGDASRIERILALTGHKDPRVRRRAISAVAALDGESTHVEALLQRLNPTVEADESVRQVAWEGFMSALSDASPGVRLQWADRLQEYPERKEAYLAALVDDLADGTPVPAEYTEARLRLANLYDGQGSHAKALPLWRDLRVALGAADDPRADAIGLSLLRATLAVGRYEGLVELITSLVADVEPAAREAIAGVVLDHLEAVSNTGDAEALGPLLDALDGLPADVFDPAFYEAIQAARQPPAEPAPQPPTTAPADTP